MNSSNLPQKDFLLIETIIKLAAINKILVQKNIMTDDEVNQMMTEISKNLAQELTSITKLMNETSNN